MGRPRLKKSKIQINYDDFSDVLYISFGNPCPGLADGIGDGNFVRIDPYTDEIVGITILNFKEHYKPQPNKDILEFAKKLIPKILEVYER